VKINQKPFQSGMTPRRASSANTSETLCIFCRRLIAGTRKSLDNDQLPVKTSINLLQQTYMIPPTHSQSSQNSKEKPQ